jgi:hypothetical protein
MDDMRGQTKCERLMFERTSSVEQCCKKPLGRFEAFGLI